MNCLIKISVFFLIFVLSGCVVPPHYQKGITKSDTNSYSKITSDLNASHETIAGRNHTIVFNELNKEKLGPPLSGDRPTEINVLPGQHELVPMYYYYGSFAEGCIEFEAIAGTNYVVRHRTKDYGVSFWLETEAGEITGNTCGFKALSSKDQKEP